VVQTSEVDENLQQSALDYQGLHLVTTVTRLLLCASGTVLLNNVRVLGYLVFFSEHLVCIKVFAVFEYCGKKFHVKRVLVTDVTPWCILKL
jgi:hypothetical protein